MRLRRITLSGFKTFARRSDLVLEPGITAVVGPNGSGKSNLVDAIRWALGETNARELRGARMDEVIYAGGQGRAPMGVAEVELVIDNEDGRLGSEDAEVSLSRRVTRHGDSEYRLNGDRVRLRDLERLLGGTGLTQSGYSVVAQNDIDGIIQATPGQRRVLIEQAAGVRSLRAASDDAVDRVDRVENRLLRLHDVLTDAEPRLVDLADQALLALEQRELSERLAQLRGSLAREEWRAARARAHSARQRLGQARSRAEAAAEAELGFRDRLAFEHAGVEEQRAAQAEVAARLESARVAAERAGGEVRRWQDRATAAVLARGGAAFEFAAAATELERGGALLGEAQHEVAERSRSASDAAAVLSLSAAAREEAEAGLRPFTVRLRDLQELLDVATHRRERAEAGVRDGSARVSLLEEALAGLAGEADSAEARAAALAEESVRSRAALVALEVNRAAAEVELDAVRVAEVAAREAARQAEGERSRAHGEAGRLLARAAALHGEIEGRLGQEGAISRAVREGRLGARRLVDTFRIPAEDAPALEAALEAELGAWVVEDLAEAARMIGGDVVREHLLRLDATAPEPVAPPPGVRAALSALSCEARVRGCLARLLDGVWLAPDVVTAEAAVAAAGGRAVLPDGTVLSSIGMRSGGRPGRTLELAAAEQDAAAEAAAAVAVAEEMRGLADQAQLLLRGAEQATEMAAAAAAGARTRCSQAESQAAGAAAVAGQERARAAALALAAGTRRDELEIAVAAVATARGELEGAREAHEVARRAVEAERAAHRAQLVGVEECARRCRAAEVDGAAQQMRLDEARRRQEAAADLVDATRRRHHVAELRLLGAEGDLVIALIRGAAAAAAAGAATGEVERALEALRGCAEPLLEAERVVHALEVERAEVAVAAARASDERAAAEQDLATCEARVAELADAVRGNDEDEGPEPDAAAALRAEREIVKLERRISAMGPVNGLAPEHHTTLERRVVQLRADRDDLSGAAADIRVLAAELGIEIGRRFEAVFGAVSFHFHSLFEELFPGGRATLRLQEEPAIEEGDAPARAPLPGVEILAQPPGKRLQPLTLFSGGERALTALAVILALQHVNPSPFYLFDEVDAPLDDANVRRFTRLLRRLAERQQFVVVTHNHATMAAADSMYGVTIGSDGVSSLLSVRFDPDAARVEPVPRPVAAAV